MDAIVQKCTSLYISELRVFLMKNSILYRTTDILSVEAIFRAYAKVAINAPKDGRGIKQQQVLEQNLSSTDVHGCIVLA